MNIDRIYRIDRIRLEPDLQDFMGYEETTERTEDTENHQLCDLCIL